MVKKFELAGGFYEIDYDDSRLDALLENLGIEPASSADYTKRTVLYYSAGPKWLRQVYDKIAAEDGIKFNTVVMYIKKGLNHAVYNGKLKGIDDLVQGTIYDYDYGFTNKEFIALICDYMQNRGYIKVREITRKEYYEFDE